MHSAVRALAAAAAVTLAVSTFAFPANADTGNGEGSGQFVVNPARCAAQGGSYSTSSDRTARSCAVTTSAAPVKAFQLLGGPVGDGPYTAAYFQIARVATTTTTTTANTTTTAPPQYVDTGIDESSPITCAYGSILDIVAGTATPIDCAGLGIPDLSTSSVNPVFILA